MMTRSLLLKGLAGVAALGGTVGGLAVYRKEIFGWGKAPEEPKSEDVSKLTDKELIDKAGLSCQLTDDALADSDTKDCTVKDNGTINVKVRDKEEEGVTFSSSDSPKLKVSKSEEVVGGKEKYNKKLKFVVDSGDLTLSKKDGGGAATTIPKLEQFETYEVFLRDGKFYLRRKTDAKEEKIKALELPTGEGKCSLPENGDSSCTLTIEEAKKIKFENQSQGITVTGTVGLKVSKMTDSTDFTDGYRFTFTFPEDVTINTKSLKARIPYDFKIKKPGSGNAITLEKAWSEDKEFAKKAGLKCESNSECSVPADSQNLNVKVGKQTKEGISSISNGKIKMETEKEGYNQGLKFTITTGDISISSDAGEIQKLEELETYEITEDKGKYYLTRKTTKEESIRSSLVLPKGCDLPTGTEDKTCTLSNEQLKDINFEGKESFSPSGTATLTITKGANTTDFPLGYKFTFNTTAEETIKSGTTTIKANIPTDFKIKKEDGKVSLEKAWDDSKYSFAAKVGLDCTTESDGCCTKSSSPSPDINVKRGNETKTGITSFGTSDSGKIKVEKDQEGYNQGLKFTISGGDVSLTSGSGTIDKLEELETYEITEEGGKYYLTRKTEASETIGDLLGLPDKCKLSSSTVTCNNLSSQDLQKISFKDKESEKPTIASNGTATLTISKADSTDFPLGYKFTLQSQQEITIKTDDKVAAKIPTDFKIKKSDTGGQTTLSLEKAWTADSLGKKVGLTCTGGTECTIETSGGQLKVKQQDKHNNDIKSGGLSKSSSSGNGKIKVTKDQAGYNQGFKFEISEGSIDLQGSTGNDDGSKIHNLGEYETYEIKEEGNDGWYLVRKNRADGFIKEKLGIKEFCSESENFPHTSTESTTCNFKTLEGLKKVKFAGENGSDISGTVDNDSNQVQLQIKKDTKLPGGFKFNFSGGNNVCIPDGNGGKVSLGNNNSGVDYKINKNGADGSWCLEKKDSTSGSSQCASK